MAKEHLGRTCIYKLSADHDCAAIIVKTNGDGSSVTLIVEHDGPRLRFEGVTPGNGVGQYHYPADA